MMAPKDATAGETLERGRTSPVTNTALSAVAGAAAVVTVVGFILGVAMMTSSGVETLIPETGGGAGADWLAAVDDGGDLFSAGAWVVVFAGLVGLVALVGFYDMLRAAGPHLIIAPLAGAVGMTLVTISHTIPI